MNSGIWPLCVIVFGSALIAVLRFTVPGHDLSWPGTYEALAHLWCGLLIGLAWASSKLRRVSLIALGLITVLETIMFLLR
jgi:hypothetical protein